MVFLNSGNFGEQRLKKHTEVIPTVKVQECVGYKKY